MNVSLTPELEKFVTAKVRSGRYNSASEVVREALRLLEGHDEARASQLTEFNRELGRRLNALDRGERPIRSPGENPIFCALPQSPIENGRNRISLIE